MDLTETQRKSIEKLQAQQDPNATDESRLDFMRKIISVPRAELDKTPEPPKQKRGRKPENQTPNS